MLSQQGLSSEESTGAALQEPHQGYAKEGQLESCRKISRIRAECGQPYPSHEVREARNTRKLFLDLCLEQDCAESG